MNAPFFKGSLLSSRASTASLYGIARTSNPRLWCGARVLRPGVCLATNVPRSFSTSHPLAVAIPDFLSRSCAPQPTTLKFFSDRIWNATHRSRISRVPRHLAGHTTTKATEFFMERFRERLNAIPSTVLLWTVLGLNGVVYAMWSFAYAKYRSTGDPGMYLWMRNNFTASMHNVSAGRIWTLLTSAFSHEGTAHILMNAFTLYFMAPAVMAMLGNTAFLSLYLGGGLTASLGSLWWHNNVKKQPQYASHGASGAIYAVISFFACVMPRAQFYFFAVLPIPAWAFVGGVFLWDGYSALQDQRGTTDTAGHIGGLLAGMAYYLRLRFRLF
ncbi:hypothetical protein B0H21DRAFT_684670 [Amylocystis lapponica]|nr:hypothetical protein B0H21DRAFT_684670 [Amylocystis lapponica]